jgi:hypothetical protein
MNMETAITNMESLTARRLMILALIGEYTAKGLGNCQNVAMLKKELAQICFDRYKDKYPEYLFFTDEQFDEVVKRNELVKSTVEAYTGYIPDECFKAVQNENIDREDLRESTYMVKIASSYDKGNWFTLRDVYSERLEKIKAMSVFELKKYLEEVLFDDKFLSYREISEHLYGKDYFYLSTRSELKRESEYPLDISATLNKDYSDLYIACPEPMIDKGKQKRKITEYFKIKSPEPKDPIVFRYVKDGVLVITFWK